MLSSAATAALRDIAHHIDLAVQFTAGFDYEGFVADPRTIYAVTRCPEIISEASRRLPDDLKARHPAIAWRDMAGAGNIYRHDYEDVAAQHVWDTVQIDLPPSLNTGSTERGHQTPRAGRYVAGIGRQLRPQHRHHARRMTGTISRF